MKNIINILFASTEKIIILDPPMKGRFGVRLERCFNWQIMNYCWWLEQHEHDIPHIEPKLSRLFIRFKAFFSSKVRDIKTIFGHAILHR